MNALYRKWRPQKFEDVVGQEAIVKILTGAIKKEKIAHAYLFSGPRGVGKTTVARLLAKAAVCQSPAVKRPCNECAFCKLTVKGQNVDLVEIDAASNRGIDEIRVLREKIHFAPAKAPVKTFIIDEVHMLTKEAFNALLKILEEPPRHAIFVMATTELHKVPATIISRCQRFDFKLASLEVIKTLLAKIAPAEKIAIDEEALDLICQAADGSYRDAISFLDQLSRGRDDRIDAAMVREVLGLVSEDEANVFLNHLILGRQKEAISQIERLKIKGVDWGNFVNLLEQKMEKFLMYRVTGEASLSIAEREVVESAKDIDSSLLLEFIEKLIATEQKIKWSSLPELSLETLTVWFCGKIGKGTAGKIITSPAQNHAGDEDEVTASQVNDIFS